MDIKRLGFDIKVDLLKKKALIFEEEVNCRGYVFPEVPSDIEEGFFEFAIFKDSARFDWAIFKGKAWFICATFEKDVGFRYTTFETGTRFNGCSFKGKVSFAGSKFKLIRGLDESIFDLPDSEAEALRIQRMCYEEEGRKEDADNTFVKERRALRRARVYNAKKKSVILFTISSISSIIEYFLADLTCKYGTDWIRPVILWVFSVFFLFPLLYWILKGVEVHSIFDYIYFSIITATTLGYGDFHPVRIGKAIASIEAIFGTFMWTVFLVVFTRKYMR